MPIVVSFPVPEDGEFTAAGGTADDGNQEGLVLMTENQLLSGV